MRKFRRKLKKQKVIKVVDVLSLINPSFYDLWLTEKPYVIAYGGRSSFKSSVVSLKLVTDFLADPEGNVVVFRKVAKSLSMTVYEQIKWAMEIMGVSSQFKFYKAPLKIVHKKTGTAFYFSGADDYEKIKGLKIAKGYVTRIWFEEANGFTITDLDQIKVTLTRQKLPNGKQVRIFYTYNPPKNPYDPINTWVDSVKGDPDYFFHHSTYLDDELGFLSQQILDDIERYKRNDLEYYKWLFLGEIVGLGTNVYNMNLFKPIKEIPSHDKVIALYYGIDTGYQVSATTFLCVGLTAKGNAILLSTYYYSPRNKSVKKAPSDFSKKLNQFIKATSNDFRWSSAHVIKITIDSAEGGLRNQYFKDYGERLHPVAKKRKIDMISYVQDLLALGRFFYLNTESNQVFIEEHRRYQWDEKTKDTKDPKVVKDDDHTCDALQYIVTDNLRDFDLKF